MCPLTFAIVLIVLLLASPSAWCFSRLCLPITHQRVFSTARCSSTRQDAATTTTTSTGSSSPPRPQQQGEDRLHRLQGKLLKEMRKICKDYQMIQEGDHVMICVSGGKDSATLLSLFLLLQKRLPVNFEITAVHVDQKQPGYNGTSLVQWLDSDLDVKYKIVEEDTYSIVLDKTDPGKSFCAVCSRLRRGILYTTALELGCNKIALGHHADDALETLLLNMVYGGQMKAMPARYQSKRGSLAVMRPLIASREDDIAEYAALMDFPILPCNLCSNQADLQRPTIKMLLKTLQSMNPTAGQNMLRACQDVRPSHLLDQSLRKACGMDPITGEVVDDEDAQLNA